MSYLETLVAATRARVEELRATCRPAELRSRAEAAEPPRGFRTSLTGGEIAIIAEIKRSTPSRGLLAPGLDAAAAASSYAAGGAAAISVLTEPTRFDGSLADLAAARGAGLPVLRKDFILDDIQVLESRAAGADAMLLIVRIAGDDLKGLIGLCEGLGMDALVEVFDEADVERAHAAGASLIGVNHRDLETFALDPQRTLKLAPLLEPGATLVALSGVSTRADVLALEDVGVAAVLVGEALVTEPDPAAKIRSLRGLA